MDLNPARPGSRDSADAVLGGRIVVVGRSRMEAGGLARQAVALERTRMGVGVAIGLTVAMFVGVLVLVAAITAVVVLTLGDQIANVFSNVVGALNSPLSHQPGG